MCSQKLPDPASHRQVPTPAVLARCGGHPPAQGSAVQAYKPAVRFPSFSEFSITDLQTKINKLVQLCIICGGVFLKNYSLFSSLNALCITQDTGQGLVNTVNFKSDAHDSIGNLNKFYQEPFKTALKIFLSAAPSTVNSIISMSPRNLWCNLTGPVHSGVAWTRSLLLPEAADIFVDS